MKIIVIGPTYPYRGGISHFTTQLSRQLVDAGHVISNISFKRQYPAWLYPGKTDKDPSQQEAELDVKYLLDPLYPWTWRKAVTEIVNFEPETVILPWWTTFWGPAFWSIAQMLRRQGIQIIFLVHNVLPHEEKAWDQRIATAVLKSGDKIIVLSENEQARLYSLIPDAETILIPHPIYNQYQSWITKKEARQQLKLPAEIPVILFFGIIRPYKGLKYAIEAISILKSKQIHATLVVAGEFWENIQTFEALIARLDLSEQVMLFNRYIPDDEVIPLFKQADIFIAPYVDGTQSGSVKIALGFGMPIVVTEPIADDLLKGSSQVIIVPPGDSQALAEAIEMFIEAGYQEWKPTAGNGAGWEKLVSAVEDMVAPV